MGDGFEKFECIQDDIELLDEQFQLTDEQEKELSELYDGVGDSFQTGKIVKGIVVSRGGGGVVVDISYKSDGIIPSYEFSEHELGRIKVGDDLEVLLDRLESEDGNVVLSHSKAKSIRTWEKLMRISESDEVITGVVTGKVKGGLNVDIGIPAFLPGSQVDIQRVMDFDKFVGTEVICKILKVNKRRGNVIISRRKYLEEIKQEDKKRALETIAEEQVINGIVKNITNYGVFVDIGGIDGLLHIVDMSWQRISHPSELVKIGDTVTVKVLSFDRDHEKISLGMKQLQENPWEGIEEKYSVSSRINGRISSITDYGLFVEVGKGIEGLVHISEISWTERISNLSKIYSIDDKVEVIVVAFDKDKRRMSLSIKRLSEDPWSIVADRYEVGERVSSVVRNVTDFGIFVQLMDGGIDGLIHISDVSWTEHIVNLNDRYKKGDSIDAIILSIDTGNRKVSLGIKQLEEDPWTDIATKFPVGSSLNGVVSKIASYGAFVKLSSGIEGLVHISELAEGETGRVDDVLTVGDEKVFRVISVSEKERKIGLSLKGFDDDGDSSKQDSQPDLVSESSSESTSVPEDENISDNVDGE
jgi:small subunit ribosomal protein S1